MLAPRFELCAAGGLDLDMSLRAADRAVGPDLDALGREASQLFVVVTAGLELRQGPRRVVENHGGRIVRGEQRFELCLIGAESAMHPKCTVRQPDADLAHRGEI